MMADFNISNHDRLTGARVAGQGEARARPARPVRRREPSPPRRTGSAVYGRSPAHQKNGDVLSKKRADAHLYLYDQGVVVTGPDDHAAAYEWRTTRVLQHRMSVNGSLVEARYTLIAPDGAATAIGPGSHSLTGRELDRLGVTSLTKGALWHDLKG
ncbi:hypothetical protein ACFHW2_02010 [Actinomadura sp. LOL_016]|uniref:hypothetical protein n=1 Tax=unclassified Actinomadura TaxID=2626254 RepID=UPI003A80D41B